MTAAAITAAVFTIAMLVMRRRHSREVDRLSDLVTQAITEMARLRDELAAVRAAHDVMRRR